MGVAAPGGEVALGMVELRDHGLLGADLPASVARKKWALSLVCDQYLSDSTLIFSYIQ